MKFSCVGSRRLPFVAGGAMLLCACAANQLRLESASAVSASSTAVVEASKAALAEVRARRTRANAVLVASDPSCFPTSTVYIRLPHQGPQGALCADGAAPQEGVDLVPLDLRPISEVSFQPTMILSAALADYSAALAKIVAQPTPDISKELSAMAEKAGAAKAIADGLLGTSLPDAAKALATDQAKVAIELLQLAADLSTEAAKVEDVRRLVAAKDADIARISSDLARQTDAWLQFSAASDARLTTDRLQAYYRRSSEKLSFDQRLAFVELISTSRTDQEAVQGRASAMKTAIESLDKSRATLARHLSGKFTAAEKRRIAEIERQRIFAALKLLAQAATKFI